MTLNKLVVFLCLAALATCGPARNPHSLFEAKLGDIFDDAHDSLDNLAKTVSAVVKTAIGKVDELEQQFNKAENDLAIDLPARVDGVLWILERQFATWRNYAYANGHDPTACVGNSEAEMVELPPKYITPFNNCLSSKVQETIEVINKTRLTIDSVFADIDSIDIDSCKNQPSQSQPDCIKQVTDDIASKLISLPNKVTSTVTSLVTIVPKNINGLGTCDPGIVVQVTILETSIVQKFADCIQRL